MTARAIEPRTSATTSARLDFQDPIEVRDGFGVLAHLGVAEAPHREAAQRLAFLKRLIVQGDGFAVLLLFD
jgi:hypothetical protein